MASLRADGPAGVLLSVRDDGVGLPESFDPTTSKTLGSRLIGALTEQVGVDLEIDQDRGMCIAIRFQVTPAQHTTGAALTT